MSCSTKSVHHSSAPSLTRSFFSLSHCLLWEVTCEEDEVCMSSEEEVCVDYEEDVRVRECVCGRVCAVKPHLCG